MARRRPKAKRSLASLPKGLPQRNNKRDGNAVNPFEASRSKRAKHEVHNRPTSQQTSQQSALAKSLQKRQAFLKNSLDSQKRANSFVDRRIGEYNSVMTQDEQMMARLVKERSRRSKRAQKYSLQEEEEEELTHKGRAITNFKDEDHVMLSDDEEDDGNLDALDTAMHFGGGSSTGRGEYAAYGPTAGSTGGDMDMSQLYSQKKTELDDLIARRKLMKAERMKRNEEQEEAFETMDESFSEIAKMLQFRDKAKERKEREDKKASGNLSDDEQEMADWDKEMKTYLFERRVKATDRTKTPEEVAKEEAERLHKLETRRLARMNGDFDEDDLTDISDDESKYKKKKTRKTKHNEAGGDELDDSDANDNDEMQVKFTADGLMYVDKDGKPVKKVGDTNKESDASSSSSDEDDNSDDSDDDSKILQVGAKVQGKYRVKEQYNQQSAWYDGVITSVNKLEDGSVTYDVTYDDGDFEENMDPENVRQIKKTAEEHEQEVFQQSKEVSTKRKRQKAKEKARKEIPFVFEVPTTLDALHDMIGNYASTGEDVSLIIQRIHKSNSIRLNHKNREKMQNFHDVLLRRFIAVGDAIHSSGDGGPTLGRYKQLDELTKTLYAMAQDSPECAAAVWGRRLGFFQNAHAKRLRDAEFAMDDDDYTAWPSTGTILLLRAIGHIFPVTDLRHPIVTPAVLLVGQMIAQTPVRSLADAVMGLTCTGLMIEFTKNANRLAPEAISFLAGTLRLFSIDPGPGDFSIPSLEAATEWPEFESLRETVSGMTGLKILPRLSLVKQDIESDATPMAILSSTLHLVECQVKALGGSLDNAEAEAFAEITKSLLALKPKSKTYPLPNIAARKVSQVASIVSSACQLDAPRIPLQRRSGPSVSEKAIKPLAPRMEDPTRYSMSKDKNKSSVQAARDRARREYKREQKAVARELRLDSAFIESERRKEKDRKDSKARDKRNKNFAWLESEQAVMNQQVRQGGGLLSGGGMGAARAKARSGKVGIKKGGKLR